MVNTNMPSNCNAKMLPKGINQAKELQVSFEQR